MEPRTATCSLTNLPIEHGEKVVLFVVKSGKPSFRRNIGDSSEPLFSPVGLPIQGIYNENTYIDLDETLSEYHEQVFGNLFSVTTFSGSQSDFIESVRSGTLVVDGHEYSSVVFKHVPLLRLTEALGSQRVETDYNASRVNNTSAILSTLYETASFYQRIGQVFHSKGSVKAFSQDEIDQFSKLNSVEEALEKYFGKNWVSPFLLPQNFSATNISGLNLLALTDMILHKLRRTWTPPSGIFSDNYALELHMLLADETIYYASRLDKEAYPVKTEEAPV